METEISGNSPDGNHPKQKGFKKPLIGLIGVDGV